MFFDGPVKHTLTQGDSKSESEKTWILRCACWLCNRPKEKIYRRRPSKKQIENFVNQNCEERNVSSKMRHAFPEFSVANCLFPPVSPVG